METCEVCEGDATHRCACGSADYCGRACQTEHWPLHAKVCLVSGGLSQASSADAPFEQFRSYVAAALPALLNKPPTNDDAVLVDGLVATLPPHIVAELRMLGSAWGETNPRRIIADKTHQLRHRELVYGGERHKDTLLKQLFRVMPEGLKDWWGSTPRTQPTAAEFHPRALTPRVATTVAEAAARGDRQYEADVKAYYALHEKLFMQDSEKAKLNEECDRRFRAMFDVYKPRIGGLQDDAWTVKVGS